ncbi:carbohydrate ABC transporter permease [Acidihalobacter ferrooxydans]|uniref:ABC transporter permease n=1 Tax=Acidihalobacter ferrooxydans TaxID=1765967 RepID=A0A1P8UK56_9GAMM|nr:sugar ABC transporter permease [Acidihalobacter ferrooxydans]APZ44211.1 ABC transporter permease [Acidihalobacter ferrooxydans]
MSAAYEDASRSGIGNRLQRLLPKLVLSPTFLAAVFFLYGFIVWTIWLSLTRSTLLPSNTWAGLAQYRYLFDNGIWWTSLINLGIFGVLYIGLSMAIGLFLAILLDQRIRGEAIFRVVYLYPMALSLIVTGVAWKWMLNPGLGVQQLVRDLGFTHFSFNWLINPQMAIYTLVIAAVWQSSGFVMALFLAGLRGVDDAVIKAAMIDGASLPRIYWSVVIPSLRPTFFSALILLTGLAIKSFDLIMAMTGGGPGFATYLPANFMYDFAFQRGQIAMGAASAVMMLIAVGLLVGPFILLESRRKSDV